MPISRYSLRIGLAGFLSFLCTAALAQAPAAPPACGHIHVKVHGVALPDNGDPPHQQILDQTWPIRTGAFSGYVNPDGSIVTQGYPNNGGSYSHEYLSTDCAVKGQGQNPPTLQLKLAATSRLNSGVGPGTGASSDYDTDWFVVTTLPAGVRWNLSVIGIVSAANVTPRCSVRVNSDQPRPIPSGPFIHTFANLSGVTATFFSCSQGHIAIFPNGPTPGTTNIAVNSDVTLNFGRSGK